MLINGLVEELLKLKKTHEKTCFRRLHYEIKDDGSNQLLKMLVLM